MREDVRGEKQKYERPTLREFGPLARLTQAGTKGNEGQGSDGGNPAQRPR
jgi:hypothetical protein